MCQPQLNSGSGTLAPPSECRRMGELHYYTWHSAVVASGAA